MRLQPSFLVIGAQKSGTTSMHAYLCEHPAVGLSTPKEVHYFDRQCHRGPAWYRSHFPSVSFRRAVERRTGSTPAIGEVNPDYLFEPDVPARVHAFDPNLRLIALIRDPVDRAFSHYHQECALGREHRSFEQAVEREQALEEAVRLSAEAGAEARAPHLSFPSYLARGRYAEQLERWLALFPPEQLLVLLTEDLARDPARAMGDVFAFLDLPTWQTASYPRHRRRTYPAMAPATRARLARHFEEPNRRLSELLDRKPSWLRSTQARIGEAMWSAQPVD